jgi:alpha-ketoglutarate-dependent sulfate ester dioxygenase
VTTLRTETGLTIDRLTGNIGAEIGGVDTGQPLGDEVIGEVRQALLDHRVVFLRDQDLDYERQVAFAQRFGALTLGHPTLPSPESQPFLEEVDSATGSPADRWHTDVTFCDQPPAFTFLHGVVMPDVGGDTMWANTVSAYRSLPQELRDLADTLRIVHTNFPGRAKGSRDNAAKSQSDDATPRSDRAKQPSDEAKPPRREEAVPDVISEYRRQFVSRVFRTEHPAVRVHPETGERSLVVGNFAESVVGYDPQASRDLIRKLQDYVTRPEQTVRWRWRAGDLAIWDNRATQHVAVVDYGNARRRAERVTVAGPVPVGVDGRPSRSLEGDASEYYAGIS